MTRVLVFSTTITTAGNERLPVNGRQKVRSPFHLISANIRDKSLPVGARLFFRIFSTSMYRPRTISIVSMGVQVQPFFLDHLPLSRRFPNARAINVRAFENSLSCFFVLRSEISLVYLEMNGHHMTFLNFQKISEIRKNQEKN